MTESIQGLERGKFTPDSNSDISTVRTTVDSGAIGDDAEKITRDQIRHDIQVELLEDILEELQKINVYFALITKSKI